MGSLLMLVMVACVETGTEAEAETEAETATETESETESVSASVSVSVSVSASGAVAASESESVAVWPALEAGSRIFVILARIEHPNADAPHLWAPHETPLGDILLVRDERPVSSPRTFTFPSLAGSACIATATRRAEIVHGIGRSDRGWEHTGVFHEVLIVDRCTDDDDARRIAIEGAHADARVVAPETLEEIDDARSARTRLIAIDPGATAAEREGTSFLARSALPGTDLELVDSGAFDPDGEGAEIPSSLRIVAPRSQRVLGTWRSGWLRAQIRVGNRDLLALEPGPDALVVFEARGGAIVPLLDALWPMADFGCDC